MSGQLSRHFLFILPQRLFFYFLQENLPTRDLSQESQAFLYPNLYPR